VPVVTVVTGLGLPTHIDRQCGHATLRGMKKFAPWIFGLAFLFWLGTTMA
jgi:hypothetical protein